MENVEDQKIPCSKPGELELIKLDMEVLCRYKCLCLNQLGFFVIFSCFDGNDGSWFPSC